MRGAASPAAAARWYACGTTSCAASIPSRSAPKSTNAAFRAGLTFATTPAVDVAAGQAGFGHRDLVGVECVLVHDRDAHLFGALRVDEHLAAQAVSNPRPAALASTPLSGAAPGRPWGGRGSRFKG